MPLGEVLPEDDLELLPVGPRPIIILDVDTLRADHLGSYGYDRPTSPNIDQLAESSVLFEWAFSQAPNTPPSQTSILSGLYPSTHGMVFDEDRLPQTAETLAESLSNAGFTTAAYIDGGYMRQRFGVDQGFELYHDNRGQGLATMGPLVFDWVEEHANEDFLLLIHTYDVHTPYQAPEPFGSMFQSGLAEPSPGFEATSEQMEAIRTSSKDGPAVTLDRNDLAWAMAGYDGGIRYVDDWIGRFIAHLKTLNLFDQAIIVLISDHGEEFQEHGSVLHDKLYATVTHIPMLLRLPEGQPATRVDTVVETIDLMPTLLDLVAVQTPSAVQGRSLLPIVNGRDIREQVAIGESPYFGTRRFIARGDHRLIITRERPNTELYRFRIDSLEQDNVATDDPLVVDQLLEVIDRWELEVASSQLASEPASTLDPETRKQLEALGYN